MRFQSMFPFFLSTEVVLSQNNATQLPLNVTALTSRDGYSVFECWQLDSVPVYAHSAMNWVVGGDTKKASLSIIEPSTAVGQAWAPAMQLTIILNGLIRITTPYAPAPLNNTAVYIMPGTVSSSILAVGDMSNISSKGHYTEFPSNEQTILVQLPYVGNQEPEHSRLYDGPCKN